MADETLNCFISSGNTAARTGFTPSPPTPAAGPAFGELFWDTDLQQLFSWNAGSASWVVVSGGATNLTSHVQMFRRVDGSRSIVMLNQGGGSGSGITALTGDVTATGPGSAAATIANSAVTLAKIASAAANSKWLGSGASGSGAAYTENSFGAGLSVSGTTVALSTAAKTRAITLAMGGAGTVLPTGIAADVYVPYACTITANTMLADQTGSIVVDIWKVAFGSYPATIANTITASALPTISSATNSQDSTLTGWTTSISAGDTLRYNVNSVTSITRLNLTLTVTVS